MGIDSDFNYSDDEIDDKNHEAIVENILNINKTQHLKKPSRTEPTSHISEFNLVKSISGSAGNVQLEKLAKVLKGKKRHTQLREKLEVTKKKTHTLPKPLEKPQFERISRSVAYERNRFLFDRWEAFVTSNRAQAHQVFPVGGTEKLSIQAKEVLKLPQTWTYKSDLEKELDKLEKLETEEYVIDSQNDENNFPLTLRELKGKRKEAAKLRAHHSFKEAKARRQNKIKSKKYHRILRKEKIKQQLKEFEELQKTDPEQALQKLEEIEKARALERFSLRHKSTGQWAKSKQVRAKYDKESRKALAHQLQISHDLTQKSKPVVSDSDDENLKNGQSHKVLVSNDDNPWVKGAEQDKELSDFVSDYRKFWTERNTKANEINEIAAYETAENNKPLSDENDPAEYSKPQSDENFSINDTDENSIPKLPLKKKKVKTRLNKIKKQKINVQLSIDASKRNKFNLNNSSGDWDIDELFEKAEEKVIRKISAKKTHCLKKSETKHDKIAIKNLKKMKKSNNKVSLDMPIQSKKPIIDEEMIETSGTSEVEKSSGIETLKNILRDGLGAGQNQSTTKGKNSSDNIDPTEFIKPKAPTHLESAVPDLVIEDNPDEDAQKNIIMEAFEDDDVVQDFTKEKKDELSKDKPQNIDLNLPGWGSWAGTGINPKRQRRRRRFIVKMPEVLPRRDDNKGSLIINEKASAKIKSHQVTEVPFPFKSVRDYEASIRAPIGNTFVPNLAFRKFTRPAVETKIGTIIEPATVSLLMGKPRN